MLKFTFSIPTLNAARYLPSCLRSIRSQDYPQDLVEIILPDGGSTDETIHIANQFDALVFKNERKLADYGAKITAKKGSGDLFVVFAADNELCTNSWLQKTATIFENFPEVSAVWGPMKSHVRDAPINKYYTLIQSDPLTWFVNRNLKRYIDSANVYEMNGEKVYIFNVHPRWPLVWGANGLTYNFNQVKDIISQEGFIGDNDVFQTLIERGYYKVAFMPSLNIYHHTVDSVSQWMRKMKGQRQRHFLKLNKERNLNWLFVDHLPLRLVAWLIYSSLLPVSATHALALALRDRDWHWLYHPLMSLVQAYILVSLVLRHGSLNSMIDLVRRQKNNLNAYY